jgi:SAM-dependent methyltransferase
MTRSHAKTIYDALGRESVHPFPARMAPGIALDVVADAPGQLRILDPMMGSGTVLALARSRGHRAYGVDIDPLAVLISRVWTTAIDPEYVRALAGQVLALAQQLIPKTFVARAYPAAADEETRLFVAYWFDGQARRQLTALSNAIAGITDEAARNVLWCALSRLIITKQAGASLAMDLSHSRPHRVFTSAPVKPFDRYLNSVDRVLASCIHRRMSQRGPEPYIYEADARSLPLPDNSIDLVLTSPPYLNAIDYMRCSKFSLVWMGYRIAALRNLRARSVGTEVGSDRGENLAIQSILTKMRLRPKLARRDEAVLVRYITDMQLAIAEVARVLAPQGKAVYVVGENTIRGTYVRNSAIVTSVARQAGLTLSNRRVRMLPANRRYLPPPTQRGTAATLDSRMRREVVLTFEQATAK